jgi:hypothetical protein
MSAQTSDVLAVGLNGQVLGLSADDGQVKWQHQVEPGGDVVVARAGPLVLASGGSRLVGVSAADGVKRFDLPVPGAWQQLPTMLVAGSMLLLASAGEVVCFELDGVTPRVRWYNQLKGRGLGAVTLA